MTSWRRRIYDVLIASDLRRFLDVWFTTSWRRSIYVVLKASNLGRLGNVSFTASSGRLTYDVFKTSDLRCLEDVQFTTSGRRLIDDVLNTFLIDISSSIWVRFLYCSTCSKSMKSMKANGNISTEWTKILSFIWEKEPFYREVVCFLLITFLETFFKLRE